MKTVRVSTQSQREPILNARASMTAHATRVGFDLNPGPVKPVIFENKSCTSKDFFRLSDGFKRLFLNDNKDAQLKVPISGFGGHTRGDRS